MRIRLCALGTIFAEFSAFAVHTHATYFVDFVTAFFANWHENTVPCGQYTLQLDTTC